MIMGRKISGCHMDPAISFMMFLLRHMSFLQFVVYSLTQTFACFVAAAMTFGVYYGKFYYVKETWTTYN